MQPSVVLWAQVQSVVLWALESVKCCPVGTSAKCCPVGTSAKCCPVGTSAKCCPVGTDKWKVLSCGHTEHVHKLCPFKTKSSISAAIPCWFLAGAYGRMHKYAM